MNPHQSFGVALAAAAHGVDPATLTRVLAEEQAMNSSEAGPFHRELCKIASAAYQHAGLANTPACKLFQVLSKEANWLPSYNRFTDSVLRALGRVDLPPMAKSASLPAAAAAAAASEKSGVPSMLKTLIATGAISGTALGSLFYLFNRNSQQSSADAAADLEKIKTYHALAREIDEDMTAQGAMDLPSARKDGETAARYEL